MLSGLKLGWPLALAGMAAAVLLMPAMILLARRIGLVDRPAHRKIHTTPVPYLGGLGVWLALAAAVLLWRAGMLGPAFSESYRVWGAVLASGAAMLIGLLDDKYQIRARYKLAAQIVVASAYVFAVDRFDVLTLPGLPSLQLGVFALPITAFWIVVIINAINLIDGVDGLAASVCCAMLLAAAAFASAVGDTASMHLALAGAGAALGFLCFNWRPAKIYLGDAGSHGLGMLCAALLIGLGRSSGAQGLYELGVTRPEPFLYQIIFMTLLAAYPALEVTLSVVRRTLRGKSIGSADRGHIHHRLLQKDWRAPWICVAAVGVQVLCAGVVLASQTQYRGIGAWLLAAVSAIIGTGLHYCGYLTSFMPWTVRESRPHFLIANHFISMQKLKLELATSLSEVLALVNQTALEFDVKRYVMQVPKPDANGGGDTWAFQWERPSGAHGTHLTFLEEHAVAQREGYTDRFTDPEQGGEAEWTFEFHNVDEDIDVEYRVLMSEFMRRALARAETLGELAAEGATPDSLAKNLPPTVTSSLLKRRSLQRA